MVAWRRAWPTAMALVVAFSLGAGTVGFYAHFHFDVESFRGTLFSLERWESLSRRLETAYWPYLLPLVTVLLNALALLLGKWRGRSWGDSIRCLALANTPWLVLWLHVCLVYSLQRFQNAQVSSFWQVAYALVVADTALFVTVGIGGWLAGIWHTAFPPRETDSLRLAMLRLAIVVVGYAVGFSLLSILQYRALHVPHGDTAMYEEHLWNALHGKGFRSQLDGGRLFLGEHVQLIHLLLTPIYLLYPSLTTLNVCQSVALASGAIAVYLLSRHFGLSATTAWTLGFAYLLYFPLQYLNLEASWKTFRPTSFCVPLVLFAFLALEKHRLSTMLVLLGLAVLGQEEYALLAAATCVFLACRHFRGPLGRREIALGLGAAAAFLLYLALTLSLIIPYFRGDVPHYTPYFEGLGDSPAEIVQHLVLNPGEIGRRLTSVADIQFLLLLLVPLAFFPLASPKRFAVSLPIFGYLMLADRQGLVQPWFHFHAPLIPILFWSTTKGIANLSARIPAGLLARVACSFALVSCFWYGRAALSWKFYDPFDGVPWKRTEDGPLFEPRGSYWKSVYWPQERARAFPDVFKLIDPEERIAATDYLRPRFTHHRAAHDYPFRPHVNIDEIDVMLIDKTEGWWGRDEKNPDRELLRCLRNRQCVPGTIVAVQDRPFLVVHHDPYYLLLRQVRTAEPSTGRPGSRP